MKNHFLVDGVQRNNQNPATFQIPSLGEKYGIIAGNWVKVCANDCERFWAKVTKVDKEVITAIVDNDLVLTSEHGLVCGDEIKIGFNHILNILKE